MDLLIRQSGREVFSRWASGDTHHKVGGDLTHDMLKAIIGVAKSGDKRALQLLDLLKQGKFGVDVSRLNRLMNLVGKGLLSLGSLTTLDACARQKPADFPDTLMIIGTLGFN